MSHLIKYTLACIFILWQLYVRRLLCTHRVITLAPIKIKVRRNKTAKHYGVLFTCLSSRAIHCELATDASNMEFFYGVLRRFFWYSGYPKLVMGAEWELRVMIEGLDKTKLKEFFADRGMKWQVTTPVSPIRNGCFDSMVKTTKSALKKIIGDAVLTLFELLTWSGSPVNERPIARIPNDPDDGALISLSKRHLFGQSHRVPQGPFHHTDKSFYSKSWQHEVFSSNREQILLPFKSARLTLTLLYTILGEKVPFLCTFYWEKIPLSHTNSTAAPF